VSAGYEGKKFILEIAHSRGVRAVVIDDPTSWANGLAETGLIDKFIGMDMNRADSILVPDIMKHLDEYTKATGHKIDAVVSFVELAIETAAKLAEALHLPGPASKSIAIARSKPDTRDCIEAAGLPKVTHFRINKRSDIEEAIKVVNFPVIMKPVSGVSSLGVLKVEKPEDLMRVYDESCKVLQSVVVGAGGLLVKAETPLQESEGSQPRSVAQERINTFVVEEFLDGYEVDIDLIMEKGKCIYRLLTDNGPCTPPYFAESWSLVPSVQLTEPQVKETEQLAIDTALALGLTHGVFHVEGKYTSRGARLIEFNARLGGGEVYETNLRATGVCLVVEALLLACGASRGRVLRSNGDALLSSVAGLCVLAPCSGSLPDVEGFLAKYRAMPGVSWMSPKVADGQHIVGPEEGLPDWLCIFLIDLPPGRGQEALDKCQQIERAMTEEYLELIHPQQSGSPAVAFGAVHPPRRTHSKSWPADPLESHHLEG
jgi:biotin carboxylase